MNIRIAILIIIISWSVGAQNNVALEAFNSFSHHMQAPRELAYGHLNKSIYINGETLGFTIYVFDKSVKTYATRTRNMYVTISDENENIIKSKMVLVINGVCNGTFFIDEALTSGNYTFRAFTNYMKNFEEQNYFIQNFRILVSNESDPITQDYDNSIDAQLLAEGGHFINNILNTIGIVLKDNKGKGLGESIGTIIDDKGIPITNFKTDKFGIGKVAFTPKSDINYKAKISTKNKEYSIPLPKGESRGIGISIMPLPNRIAIQIRTNAETLETINNEEYTLAFHNGKIIKSISIKFTDTLELTKFISTKDLFSGINIFTLFDAENRPILERLFFNYDGIDLIKNIGAKALVQEDSISMTLKFKALESFAIQNFSISILPNETKSYSPDHNILSYLYLQPYVRGYLEDASYYFTDISIEKQRQLDNLLITQGWSSYNWEDLFAVEPNYLHNFENGISITANIQEGKKTKYWVATSFSDGNIIKIDKGQTTFKTDGLIPFADENLNISSISSNGSLSRPSLYVQFSPSSFPEFENFNQAKPPNKPVLFKGINFQDVIQTSWTGFEQLEEIVYNVVNEKSEIEKYRNLQLGKIDDFTKENKSEFRNFESYLKSRGYGVSFQNGQFVVSSLKPSVNENNAATVYLDNVKLSDLTILAQMNMDIVDFIVIDTNSTSLKGNGDGESIRIFTDPTKASSDFVSKPMLKLHFPITFSEAKQFYTPKYAFYKNSFFKDYGVIDWIPRAKMNADGEIEFKIMNNNYEKLKVFIEGSGNGNFISKAIEVTVEEE